MIIAECHTEDRVFEVTFDATVWFEQASNEEILELAGEGWGDGYASDAIAAGHPEPMPEELVILFKYLEHVAYRKHAPGYVVNVDLETAKSWLREHRPNLLEEIDRLGE